MGGLQTFATTIANLDKFAYIGGFSGSAGSGCSFDPKTSGNGAPMPQHSTRSLGCSGWESAQRKSPNTKNFHEALKQAGINSVRLLRITRYGP